MPAVEYPDLSDRALADWCGVSHHTIATVREQVGKLPTSTETNDLQQKTGIPELDEEYQKAVERTGRDGKQHPATKRDCRALSLGRPEKMSLHRISEI